MYLFNLHTVRTLFCLKYVVINEIMYSYNINHIICLYNNLTAHLLKIYMYVCYLSILCAIVWDRNILRMESAESFLLFPFQIVNHTDYDKC